MINFISADKVGAILAPNRTATTSSEDGGPRNGAPSDHLLRRHANDHDALVLGRLLADAGAQLTLAYVRHSTQATAPTSSARSDAETLLERGAQWLGPPCREPRGRERVDRRGPALARRAGARRHRRVRLGLPHRAGHVAPQRSAQTLLEGGPARSRSRRPATTTSGPQDPPDRPARDPGDDAALETARELADARRDADPRRARSTCWSSAPARRPPGPGDDHRARPERDRERDLPGADRAHASRSSSRPCWRTPLSVRARSVHVAELVPEVAGLERGVVRAREEFGAGTASSIYSATPRARASR